MKPQQQLAYRRSFDSCRSWPFLRVVVAVLLATFCSAQNLRAEPALDVPKPEEPAPLPTTSSTTVAPLLITSGQALQFKKLLLPEVYPLVRSSVIDLEALARTRFEWSLGTQWTTASKEDGGRTLESEVQLRPEYRTITGFPFGSTEVVTKAGRPEVQAHKILWNAAAALWTFPVQRYSQTFTWFKQSHFFREVQANIARVYPSRLEGLTAGVQLFRERVSVTAPEALASMSYLTFRFLGVDEDLFWAFSPAIMKPRQLTGPNRTNPFLEMPVTLDDLFIWSGKHESVEATIQTSGEALVPVAGVDLLKLLEPVNGCNSQQELGTRSGGDLVGRWANEGRSPWSIFSSLSYFVQRKIWRIELTSNDPFSLYGRQILTIDQESMAPLVKLVYNRSGHPWKLIMGSLSLGESKDGARRAIFYPLIIVHDYLKDETVLVRTSGASLCDGIPPELPEGFFDVKNFSGQGSSPTVAEKE